MTQQLNAAETFIAELATAGVQMRLTSAVGYNLNRAITEHGWTIPQLVTECTRDLDTAANVAAVITDRIRIAATVAPAKPKAKISKGLPFCTDECRDNAGWILNADGQITGRCTCRSTP